MNGQEQRNKLRGQAVKRVRILENLLATRSNPAWIILSILTKSICEIAADQNLWYKNCHKIMRMHTFAVYVAFVA